MAYDAHDGRRDFHFLYGRWAVRHRRLVTRGAGADDWEAFEGVSFTQGLMDGLCNVEANAFDGTRGEGVAFRSFDTALLRWSIRWVSSRNGQVQPPVNGRFIDGVGLFEGDDMDQDRPVKVRYRWDGITASTARWSQAFSYDGGATWETNWTMDFTRTA